MSSASSPQKAGEVASPQKKKKNYRTSTHLQMSAPLDYSYQELKTLSELAEHETNDAPSHPGLRQSQKLSSSTRVEDSSAQQEVIAASALSTSNTTGKTMTPLELAMAMLADTSVTPVQQQKQQQQQAKRTRQRKLLKTTGLRLSYNELTSLDGILPALEAVMDNPTENLQWLDLSHNRLTKIDAVLLNFPNLRVLYLHGNCIQNLKQVKVLNDLPLLRKLTLHGNPSYFPSFSQQPEPSATEKKKVTTLEDKPFYRCKLIAYLKDTNLASVDFVPITNKDRVSSATWVSDRQRYLKRKREEAKYK
jgi:hypothetical protein